MSWPSPSMMVCSSKQMQQTRIWSPFGSSTITSTPSEGSPWPTAIAFNELSTMHGVRRRFASALH